MSETNPDTADSGLAYVLLITKAHIAAFEIDSPDDSDLLIFVCVF
jgi:hypothetical protein